jgi:hypothetical protein
MANVFSMFYFALTMDRILFGYMQAKRSASGNEKEKFFIIN